MKHIRFYILHLISELQHCLVLSHMLKWQCSCTKRHCWLAVRFASGHHRSTLTSTVDPDKDRAWPDWRRHSTGYRLTETIAVAERPLSVNGLLLAPLTITLFSVVLVFAQQVSLMFQDAVTYINTICSCCKCKAETLFERGKERIAPQGEEDCSSRCVPRAVDG